MAPEAPTIAKRVAAAVTVDRHRGAPARTDDQLAA